MNCPKCDHPVSRVLSTVKRDDTYEIKRVRQCQKCQHPWNTTESLNWGTEKEERPR